MNRNLNRRIHPISEADWLSPKKLVSCDPKRLAHNSYVIADAMLEASEKKQEHEQQQK